MSARNNPEADRLLNMYGALKIEVNGVRNRKNSQYKLVKREFGFSGNKAQVLQRFAKILYMAGVLKDCPSEIS